MGDIIYGWPNSAIDGGIGLGGSILTSMLCWESSQTFVNS